ncbi:hypothetical protein [Asticcacaulis tiandongensis]|uniref:hypothetical protein n=1 Tax=Asticcacaulis tiandongensis TaxID=2565365 RepID=UPI00112DC201|nr:hypothetical protein [Asticcacaulis tiandongensis]
MNDKLFYSLAAVVAVLMIGLSLVWPQGLGLRSPEPFGHEVVLPDIVRMEREREARRIAQRAEREAQAAAAASAAAADPIVTEPAN